MLLAITLSEMIDMKKVLGLGIFFVAVFALICVMGMTAEAGVTVDDTEKTITLATDAFTMDSIWADANVGNANLTNVTDGTWMANYSIIITGGATLEIGPNAGTTGCTWLKLNTKNESGKLNANIQVKNGNLWVNDTMITAWNHSGGLADGYNNTYWENATGTPIFRPYIYVYDDSIGTPRAYFLNSTIGYLGYDIDNKYGIVYEDSEASEPWGWMHNCTVMENFIGIDFQGCENMNVTNTWMNNTKDAGIVYTLGGATSGGSHGGFIGNHPSWTHRATYTGVAVDYSSGTSTAGGIRLCHSDNITLDTVDIQDAYGHGLRIEGCDNVDADHVVSYLNTNAASDYNIMLIGTTNSNFDNCTAYSPNGTADGGNWELSASTNTNTFSNCNGYGSPAHEDFYIDTGCHGNIFTSCVANNSMEGFFCLVDNNNTFTDCISHNHTLYDFKFWGSQHNTINNGSANDSAFGVYIYDDAAWNTVTGLKVNRQSSTAIQIGTSDDICHNNTIESVVVVGKSTDGYGIFIFGNCTNNYVGNSTVTGCRHDGIGIEDYAYSNTFYNCNSSNNVETGFSIVENANNNTIDNCTAYGNAIGIATRAPINYFNYCTSTGNTGYGVVVTQSGIAEFFKSVSWNPSATGCDWMFNDTTTVDVYGDYILGTNYTINNQTLTTYNGWVDHDSGDGDWLLDTYEMGVWTSDAEDNVLINLTYWQSNYRRWYGTASDLTSNIIRQYCGGLTSGLKYDLLLDHAVYGTYIAYSDTVLGDEAGIVWFNYTGTWSTHLFEIMIHSSEEPPGGNGNGGNGIGDNDIDVFVLTSDANPIVGAIVYIYEGDILVDSGITDANGLYDTSLDDGTYRFVTNADGYRDQYQINIITTDTTVIFHMITMGICPAVFAGPYMGLSILGWIVAAVLAIIGFLVAYLIDTKEIKKDYIFLLLIPNGILVILGLLCQPILIVIGIACCVIQYLWASEKKL